MNRTSETAFENAIEDVLISSGFERHTSKEFDREREKTGELEKALTDSISLLKERRSALITAAVTGQIELEDMVI